MTYNISYSNIFRATFVNTENKQVAFTAFLISSEGYLLTVAHPFCSDFKEATIINCENSEYSFETTLFYHPKDKAFDFAILKIINQNTELPNPFKIEKIVLKENDLVNGYGFGKAIAKPDGEKFDLHQKIGGKIGAGLSFSKGSDLRHVTFGDSGAPMFLNDDFTKVVGINYQRNYSKIEGEGYFTGFVLPINTIMKYLSGIQTDNSDLQNFIKNQNMNSELENLKQQKEVLEEIVSLENKTNVIDEAVDRMNTNLKKQKSDIENLYTANFANDTNKRIYTRKIKALQNEIEELERYIEADYKDKEMAFTTADKAKFEKRIQIREEEILKLAEKIVKLQQQIATLNI